MSADYSFFEFYTADVWAGRRLNVRCRYGGEASAGTGTTAASGFIETTGGEGKWEAVKRPYLPALTIWRGPDAPYQHKIPALLDGWSDGADVSKAVEEIEAMCGLTLGGAPVEPPQLVLNGYGAIPHDVTSDPHLTWVIPSAPTWGEPVRERGSGKLVRQAFTITFMVYNTDFTLRRDIKPNPRRHYRVKVTESFEKVAAQRLHQPGWGTRLAKLNDRQNARDTLKPGQEILLPDAREEQEWKKSRRR